MPANNFVNNMNINEVIERIINLSEGMYNFWSEADGWAPPNAANILNNSRLDYQLSLTLYLKNWINKAYDREDYASLILAWVNLGCLVEGMMQLALSVYFNDYQNDADAVIKGGLIQEPDKLMLDKLRTFCKGKLWDDSSKWDSWILHIQQRRNAIHAYKDRELGSFEEFFDDLRNYLEFIRLINGRLPYPDSVFEPREC